MENDLTDLEKQRLVAIFHLNKFYAPGLDKLALRVVESISEEKQRDFSFLILVDYLAGYGNLVLADEVARNRLHGYHRATALAGIGLELANTNPSESRVYLSDAEAFFDKMAEPSDRTTLLDRVSKGYSLLGDWDKSTELARRIAEPEQRATTLCEIAAKLWSAGDVKRLDSVLLVIRASASEADRSERGHILNDLAEVLAQAGRIPEAVQTWEQAVNFADYASESSKLLFSIAKNLVGVGQQQRARDVALLIKNDARRNDAISLVGE